MAGKISDWSPAMNALATVMTPVLRRRFAGKTRPQAYKLARKLIDEAMARHRRNPGKEKIACRPTNCFGCCLHQIDIDSSVFEVDRILDAVDEQGRIEEVVARAERLAAKGTGGACPLLSREGRCTVYAIRPITCASYHALDREACHSGAKAETKHDKTLWVEMCLLAGFGLVPVEEMDRRGPLPRVHLFKELAARGRARLEGRRAA